MSKPIYQQDIFRYIKDLVNRITNIEIYLHSNKKLPGELISVAFSQVPPGYLPCNGAAISRTEYPDLFSAIGTTWGSGDGSTTFNVPDLRGRALYNAGTHTDIDTVGENDGIAIAYRTPKHSITISEMPSHSHGLGPANNPQTFYPDGNGLYIASSPGTTGTGNNPGTTSTGGDGAHHHGYAVVNILIKT